MSKRNFWYFTFNVEKVAFSLNKFLFVILINFIRCSEFCTENFLRLVISSFLFHRPGKLGHNFLRFLKLAVFSFRVTRTEECHGRRQCRRSRYRRQKAAPPARPAINNAQSDYREAVVNREDLPHAKNDPRSCGKGQRRERRRALRLE